MIRIILDGEPRGKGRPRFVRATGRAYTPADTRSFEDRLRWAAQVEMRGRPLLLGALDIRVTARKSVPESWSRSRREQALKGEIRPTVKPDFDNFSKVVDALNKIVWGDDAQVVDAHIHKFYSEKPNMEIEIWTLTELF